jgi:hypothetical protein
VSPVVGGMRYHTHSANLPEVAQQALEHALIQGRVACAALKRHADMHLAGADQVDDDAKAIERREDAREEAVRDRLAV